MKEEKSEVLTIKNKQNPEIAEDKKENQNQVKITEVQPNNNAIVTSSDKIIVNQKNPTNLQLKLNKKDIIDLPQEVKIKLDISPCPICQSDSYSLYIPDSNSFSQPENTQNKPEETPKVNTETDTIKAKKTIYFPILICQQNHQRCLICNQNPHEGYFCEKQYLNYDNIVAKYDIIKPIIPEEKKNDFNLLYDFASTKDKIENSCCSWNCTWTILLVIFLLIIWTAISIALFVVGLALLAVSLGLRCFCCLYHFCYQACCTTTVTEEDKGSYILRTTTHHRDKERADEIEAEGHDEALSVCGAGGLACAIMLIPEGYKKICDWFKSWRE